MGAALLPMVPARKRNAANVTSWLTPLNPRRGVSTSDWACFMGMLESTPPRAICVWGTRYVRGYVRGPGPTRDYWFVFAQDGNFKMAAIDLGNVRGSNEALVGGSWCSMCITLRPRMPATSGRPLIGTV